MGNDWRAANLPAYIDRLDRQYAMLGRIAVGLVLAVGGLVAFSREQLLALGPRGLGWAAGLGGAVFIWLAAPALDAVYNNAVPSATRHLQGAKMILIRRFLDQFGAPRVARTLALTNAIPSALTAAAFILVRRQGILGVLSWVFLVSFALSAVLALVPHFLPKSTLVRVITNPIAAFDTWQRNPRANKLDRRTRASELGTAPSQGAVAQTRTVISLMRWGLVVLAPFYLTVIAVLALSRPAAADVVTWLDIASIVLAVILALSAFRLAIRLWIDPTKRLVEQLPQTAEGEHQTSEAIEAGLFVIDTFRENHYSLNLPMHAILSKLDAVRLWREATDNG
ncbi:MAG: hypothetical protein HYT80_01055 [Euryarchaeota archaeon]|nr:hypothetical protein [Euryarchaeota archaeon]